MVLIRVLPIALGTCVLARGFWLKHQYDLTGNEQFLCSAAGTAATGLLLDAWSLLMLHGWLAAAVYLAGAAAFAAIWRNHGGGRKMRRMLEQLGYKGRAVIARLLSGLPHPVPGHALGRSC